MDENIKCFEDYTKEYEVWFEKNQNLYSEELDILKKLISNTYNGLDIGSGSGRFSIKPFIKVGIEPSKNMRDAALNKGVYSIEGYAQNIPFKDETFNFALMMNSLCFVKLPQKALKEAFRVIKKGGFLIIGFIDKDSQIGKMYQEKKAKSKFYKNAKFFLLEDINHLLQDIGYAYEQENLIKTGFGMTFVKYIKK